jgi:2-furoyl-CoA dehydrogenase FAD binding subunit
MKAPPFGYVRPGSVAEAIEAVARDDDAKIIAGGQSLAPLLAMRLTRPSVLVDISRIAGLSYLRRDADALRIGAAVRQRDLERSAEAGAMPLIAMCLPYVGHREVRNRGTIGGSLCHADPAAELPAVAVALQATLLLQGPGGARTVSARDFFQGPFETALSADEVLTEIRVPVAGAGDRFAFEEVARRHGDFALCGAAAAVRVENGTVTRASLGLLGVAGRPLAFDATGVLAAGASPREIGADIAGRLTPPGDLHASAGYRRRLAAVLVARCLTRALGAAR